MLVKFVRETWSPGLYISIALLLIVSFVINYSYDFQSTFIKNQAPFSTRWPRMFLFQLFPFLAVCVFLYLWGKNKQWLRSKDFWICTLVGFSIIAFDRIFYGYADWIDHLDRVDFYFYHRMFAKGASLFSLVLPLLIFYQVYEKPNDSFKSYYGLKLHQTKLSPYFKLLGIASLFIIFGSFLGDLSSYYPRYAVSGGPAYAQSHNLPSAVPVLMYELVYGSTFIGVELFFRGFLIMAFTRTLGAYAVLAMVPAYAFLHFGKPMSEAISSIFGGYILGVISYNTRNIYGGIIVHVGIAWLMELMGYLQNL